MTFLQKIKARIVDKFSGGVATKDIGKHLDSLVSEDRDYTLKRLPYHMVEAGRPNGKYAVSASRDKTLKVWDLESGNVIASFSGEGELESCAVEPDGVTIVAGEFSGRVHLLRLEAVA